MVTVAQVQEAQARIEPFVRRTPVVTAVGGGLWFKAEFLQTCGVFKTRGAFNRQLAARERGELDAVAGVVAASGGNAGLANAYAAARLGVPATVFVPTTAPQVKVDLLHAYGARVQRAGTEYAEAFEAAQEYVASTGALFCHAYDQPDIAAGAGVIALEILEDVPHVDTIVVAVGGGGLFAGIAAVANDRGVRVVAAEPTRAPTLHAALAAGEPVDVSVSGVAADSPGARRLGAQGFEQARQTHPVSVLVEDEAIVAARDALWDDCRIPAEHGAATAYAALTAQAYRPASGETVVVIICGANTDPTTLGAAR
ncbi:threonine dehydratase [Kineosphaera limosa]|uniref:threonine ammonia-lyase n=1 Tax=Kineosphaera limosa NBRC 100340 TaxID=1184609 RepID=K6W7Z2_9MICO|nr:threonine/serine dehydratase [Kineosphaera limosa]NYE02108.1 threonine dehydratase [Kineosphaera limosa]GAB95290.1 putative dehydratase [Kineosphaera limosa NBRC 100340]